MIGDGLIHRRDSRKQDENSQEEAPADLEKYVKHELTLMEKVLLLGLKDKEGYTSFWNDCISSSLRGCILVELSLRGKIELENAGMRHKPLCKRKLVINDGVNTGEMILDEALKILKQSHQPETVHDWIVYLNGDSWNPMKGNHQVKNVRSRLAKSLAEKGILSPQKKSFVLFNMTTYPLIDHVAKTDLIKSVNHALLAGWINDWQRMDRHMLALIVLAQASDVLENAFDLLNDQDYEIAKNRSSQLTDLNFEFESGKSDNPLMWAVFDALIN